MKYFYAYRKHKNGIMWSFFRNEGKNYEQLDPFSKEWESDCVVSHIFTQSKHCSSMEELIETLILDSDVSEADKKEFMELFI